MRKALDTFETSIIAARQHTALYDYLSNQIHVTWPFDDLLRAQVVVTVAAFDKFVHDLIRVGVCEIFSGKRVTTARYNAEQISISLHSQLVNASIPPKEVIFEAAIVERLSRLSFQQPDKVADGLSLIWSQNDKWFEISRVMGCGKEHTITQLKLIIWRRNSIVHESDFDPMSYNKTPIEREECVSMTDFIEICGRSIYSLVL
jgi:RiboL-PSP-HEPN